jgi:hypothetical protein
MMFALVQTLAYPARLKNGTILSYFPASGKSGMFRGCVAFQLGHPSSVNIGNIHQTSVLDRKYIVSYRIDAC